MVVIPSTRTAQFYDAITKMLLSVVGLYAIDSPVEWGRSTVGERYGRSSRHVLDEVPLPDGELSHLLTRNSMLDDIASFDPRGNCYFVVFYTAGMFHIIDSFGRTCGS